MKTKRYLWILLYIIVTILPATIYVLGTHSKPLIVLSGIFGITSYVLLSFEFLLAARVKLIDKVFGLDKIYRFHMVIAVLALIFAYIHKGLKELYYGESMKTETGDMALNVFVAISIFSILMMINKLFFKIKPVDMLRNFLNNTLKIKYQYKIWIHNLMMVGLIILLVHILLASSVSYNLTLEFTLILYFAVPFLLYAKRKIYDVYFNKNKKYIVSEVIHESNNIVTLRFKPKYGKVFDYMPGQFLYVRIKNTAIPGDEHPFTISSSPAQGETVAVTVKQLGDFSGKLNMAKPGDAAIIDGPYGTFSNLRHPRRKKICFIAGGIGITPFLGMLRHMDHADKNNDVVLLWGARDMSEVICKNEIETFTTKLNNFKFVPVLSNDNTFVGEKGFIGTDLIKKYMENYLKYDFYICGPPVMLNAQLKNLISLGVPKKNIHYERFTM